MPRSFVTSSFKTRLACTRGRRCSSWIRRINFQSTITVNKGGDEPGEADGKSVMQMIILAAEQGTPLKIAADGEDAESRRASWPNCSMTSLGKNNGKGREGRMQNEGFDDMHAYFIPPSAICLLLNSMDIKKGIGVSPGVVISTAVVLDAEDLAHSRAISIPPRSTHEIERLGNAIAESVVELTKLRDTDRRARQTYRRDIRFPSGRAARSHR